MFPRTWACKQSKLSLPENPADIALLAVLHHDDTKKDDTKTDDVKKDDAGSGTQQGENTDDVSEKSENAQQSADTGVQTGDTANGFGFLAAAVAAAGAGAYEFLRKRKLIRR